MKDISGKKFGRLTVVSLAHKGDSGTWRWNCICDCGNSKIACGSSLRLGLTRSCGCLLEEVLKVRNLKHGRYDSPEYRSWVHMRSRCLNRNNNRFELYGGRGVTVCERWKDFSTFLIDMGEKPTPSHSIERLDGNGNYEPGNCVWATSQQQNRNRSDNRIITFNGRSAPLTQLALENGLNPKTIFARIYNCWTVAEAFSTPVRK